MRLSICYCERRACEERRAASKARRPARIIAHRQMALNYAAWAKRARRAR